jgi:hypothetical protein
MTEPETWAQLARYRYVKTLPGGERLLLRPLSKGDKVGLVDLFARALPEDLEYFRDDAANATVVEHWVDNLDLRRVYPLIAVVDERIVGDATLPRRYPPPGGSGTSFSIGRTAGGDQYTDAEQRWTSRAGPACASLY